jgi:hypothetical protein
MSWVGDLASGRGAPAGAATLAVAMYLGCVAAEKAARPEALKDIGRILKDLAVVQIDGSVAISVLATWPGCSQLFACRHRIKWRSNRNGNPVPISG